MGLALMSLQEVESGHMFGRISMPNEFEFVIDPLRASDVGLYECVVSYPNTLNEITHQARIVVVGTYLLKYL